MRLFASRAGLLAMFFCWSMGLGLARSAAGDEDVLKGISRINSAVSLSETIREGLRRITREDEYYLGRVAAARLLAHYPVSEEDAEAVRYLNLVGRSLTLSSERKEVFDGYRFLILDSPEVNAFAVPGAVVLVTRGMLGVARDEDDLAAIVAHEIAHIQEQHGLKLIKEQRWERFLKKVLQVGLDIQNPQALGKLTGILSQMSGDLAEVLSRKGYERRFDFEADEAAVAMLQAVGYDPRAMLDVLRAMHTVKGPGFARTHPSPKQRIKQLESFLSEHEVERPAVRKERFLKAMRNARTGIQGKA